jgi:hypothetical protein
VFWTDLIYSEDKSALHPAGTGTNRRFEVTRVLIAEGQPTFRANLRQLLTQAGLAVVEKRAMLEWRLP